MAEQKERFEPVRLTRTEPEPAELVTLFYLDDEEYKVPARFPVNVALKYLRMARTEGQEVASGWLLEQVLGEDGYTALMNWGGLELEHLEQISTIAHKLVVGELEGPKGKRKSGARRSGG